MATNTAIRSKLGLTIMKFLFILLLVLPLSLATLGEGSSKSEDPIQKAIRRHGQHVNTVLKMAKDGESINGVLRPMHFLGSGGAGFVFKGKRLGDDTPVAIKFITKNSAVQARREYIMYSYLEAINDNKVEKYGIPTVYYYGHWNGFIVTAYTELETTLAELQRSVVYQNYDILILIQQFIKQSKYMHSRGIRHNDIKLENILTRGCESFLIDFDLGSKMAEDNRGTTYLFASLKYHQGMDRVATDDWECFLYTVCLFAGITFDWFKKDLTNGTKIHKEDLIKLYGDLKANRNRILEIIEQSEQEILKPIIRAFAEEAFSDNLIPNYDRIDKIVSDALAQNYPRETCFSWVTRQMMDGTHADNSSNRKVIEESIKRANTNISDLVIPKDFREYSVFKYPKVNENFFLSLSSAENPIQKAIRWHGEHVNTVLTLAKYGKSINNVLRPLSFLSSGGAGFVFKGIRIEDDKPVTIKFGNKNRTDQAKREYEMYSYLNAINNTEAEKYGIPTVYYYGHWEGFIVTACTELGKTLVEHRNSITLLDFDLLLLMRQFIKQSKYMHSHGIRHDDIRLGTIVTRGCESFLNDFNLASKMPMDNRGVTYLFASLKYHQGVRRVAKDDWESFLYAICYFVGIPLEWFKSDLTNRTKIEEKDLLKLYAELKADRKRILAVIDWKLDSQRIVKPIVHAFAEEVFTDQPLPDYDRLYQLVASTLEQHFPENQCFSWIRKGIEDQKKVQKSIKRANTNISDLPIPEDFGEYDTFNYPHVNEEFFGTEQSK